MNLLHRRNAIAALASAAVAAGQQPASERILPKGRIKQSCFTRSFGPGMKSDDMFQTAARLGAVGFDTLPPPQWPTLKKYGLMPTMAIGGGVTIENGIIHKEMHNDLAKSLQGFLDICASGGCPNALIAGGQRKGLSYSAGADNAVAFLNQVKGHAEDKGITLCVEVMNDKYPNPALGRIDQVANHLDWVIDVCTRVNSPRVKVLFDIYHVQIMDGNVAANIKACFPLIGHFHAAGVPGRHELDETQELNYGFIFRTIADLGYTGFVAHEYDPTPGRDPIQLLEKVFAIASG
jgi:hydroxypyruvate isomerase